MKNYSYVTLLTNDSYVYGVALLVETMKQTKTQYPLHVLVIDEVHEATIEILNQLGVTYEYVEVIPTPEDIYEHNLKFEANTAAVWRNCWTKFHIFNQTQFDKIVFLDADIMILKNLDHLFDCPHMTSCLDGEYFNVWPGWDHFNSGCMVIEPSKELFDDILNYANNLKEEELPEYIFADQEVLNFYYKDWPEQKELHLNKYYDIFAPYVPQNDDIIKDIDENCYFIHYVGRKPWTFWYRNPNETYSEYFYTKARVYVEKQLAQFKWDQIRAKLKLAVYAICKNEVTNVDKWLASFGEADYVCVLDTGSKDGTWEKLQEAQKTYPNLIISQRTIVPWRYDVARNVSMTLIPKDTTIYFMADLDEVIKESGWCQEIKNRWDPLFDRGRYTYNRDIGENDAILRAIPEYRVHSSDWYKWVNVVHEAIINHAGRKTFFVETCTELPIVVWHYPDKNKQTNYMELCEQDLEECPEDYVMRLQLAIEYELRKVYDKAEFHYRYLLDHPDGLRDFEIARCYCSLGIIADYFNPDKQVALSFFREGRLRVPNVADNYMAAAELYYNNKMYPETIELCKACLQRCGEAQWCNIHDVNSFYAYWILGLSYYFLNDKVTGLGYLAIARQKNPTKDLNDLCNNMITEILQDQRKQIQ